MTRLWLFIIWLGSEANNCCANGLPSNVTAVGIINQCVAGLNVSWTEPVTNLTIKNFIIYHGYSAGESSTTTANNKNTYTLTNLISSTTYNISVSTNIQEANGNLTTWPRSSALLQTTLNTKNCKLPSKNPSETSLEYGAKLAAIVFGALVGVLLICFPIFFCAKRFMHRNYDKRDMAMKESKRREFGKLADTQIPIAAENLFDHVSEMKFSDNRGFRNEFTKLDAPQSTTGCSYANRPYNNMKNRFANVPVYDKTRVILKEDGAQVGSDYINANFISGYQGPKSYIATQAPLPETVIDFWRMIWELEISNIVMIANLIEQGTPACAKYWPDKSTINFGNITVRSLDVINYPDYVIRSFEVNYRDSFETRLVRQFHYMSWPTSRSVPFHSCSFMEFVQTVRRFNTRKEQPMVVHCSSGIGRTGIFIVVDDQIERAERQGNVNVFYKVNSARDERYQIVKSVDQYVFIHECLLEYLTFRNKNDFWIRNIPDYLAKKQMKNSAGISEFQAEFRELNRSVTEFRIPCKAGSSALNSRKNRFEAILPFDNNRVKLKLGATTTTLPSDLKNNYDYINASYISNLWRKRGCIVTQDPIEATLFDFWNMIWENGSLTIVMLSAIDDATVAYWPEEKEAMKAGKLTIRILSTDRLKYFNIRNLEVSHTEVKESKLIRQYQYKIWPDKSDEESLSAFVDFILQIKHWIQVAQSKITTVHCRAGTGKSGVFVAMSNLIERACAESLINVFKTVRTLRRERIALVQTLDQYELIYFAIANYYQYRYPRENDRNSSTETLPQTKEDFSFAESESTPISSGSANNYSISDTRASS